ncbi:unnamed protein product, partial [Trichobilharzia szidati]
SALDAYFISGHLNGWIIIWSIEKHRPCCQWIGHSGYQITSLHCWPRNNSHVIISHARDGFIRFWEFNQLQVNSANLFEPLHQIFSEIRTYDVSFCNSTFWPGSINCAKTDLYFLAHVCQDEIEGESAEAVRQPIIEVIQLPQFTFICHQSIDAIRIACKNISNLGMCMALQGVEKHSSSSTERIHCLLLAGFESGHLVLLGDGSVLSVIGDLLGQSIPIMTFSLRPVVVVQRSGQETADLQQMTRLIVLGGPSVDTCDTNCSPISGSIAFVQLEYNSQLDNPYTLSKLRKTLDNSIIGVSCFAWRRDGRLLAIGQWDGQIRLAEIQSKSDRFKIKSLGYLTSIGGLNEGSLIGDWSSTTLTKPHGPNIDQQSKLIRSCTFTRVSNYLITSVPANGGAIGSLLVWDVYRTGS